MRKKLIDKVNSKKSVNKIEEELSWIGKSEKNTDNSWLSESTASTKLNKFRKSFLNHGILPLFILFLFTFNVFSADYSGLDTLRPRYGAGISYGLGFHSSDFKSLPNVANCCPQFTSASGSGLGFGLYYFHPLNNEMGLNLALGYSTMSAKFTQLEQQLLSVDQKLVNGQSEHDLNTKLSIIKLTPGFSYRLTTDLYVNLGVGIGFFAGTSYDQIEKVINPNDRGGFQNSDGTITRTRNAKSGQIDGLANPNLSINLSASYDLPMNAQKTLIASPYIGFDYALNNNLQDRNWKTNALWLGIKVSLSPFEKIKKYIEEIKIDTIYKESELISANQFHSGTPKELKNTINGNDTITNYYSYRRTDTLIKPTKKLIVEAPKPNEKTVVKEEEPKTKDIPQKPDFVKGIELLGITGNNSEKISEINIKDFNQEQTFFILPYIFFEEQSPALPSKYYNEYNADKAEYLNLVKQYRNILQNLGEKMQKNGDIKISIKGYTDPTTENANCALAKLRAQSVRAFLMDNYHISDSRINLKTQEVNCIPTDLTRSQTEEGFAENRRLEIEINDFNSVFAINKINKSNKITNLDTFAILLDLDKDQLNDPHKINLELTQNDKIIYKDRLKEGNRFIIDKNKLNNIIESKKPILINIKSDANGIKQTTTSKIDLNFENQENTSYYMKLPQFNVSQSTLDDRMKKELKAFVAKLNSDYDIVIRGFSDKIGVVEENKKLSGTRANAVREYMKQIKPSLNIVESLSVGSEYLPQGLYSYDSPEERFMSRTVEIEAIKRKK